MGFVVLQEFLLLRLRKSARQILNEGFVQNRVIILIESIELVRWHRTFFFHASVLDIRERNGLVNQRLNRYLDTVRQTIPITWQHIF